MNDVAVVIICDQLSKKTQQTKTTLWLKKQIGKGLEHLVCHTNKGNAFFSD